MKDNEGEKQGETDGSLQSTGHLGDVMKESTEIAYTYAKVYYIALVLTCDKIIMPHIFLRIF